MDTVNSQIHSIWQLRDCALSLSFNICFHMYLQAYIYMNVCMCCDIYIPRYTRIFPIFTMGWLGLFAVTGECTYIHTYIYLPTYLWIWLGDLFSFFIFWKIWPLFDMALFVLVVSDVYVNFYVTSKVIPILSPIGICSHSPNRVQG